jgi:NAD-dependent dihydropyrimidine dehydrogenase PreA subunit
MQGFEEERMEEAFTKALMVQNPVTPGPVVIIDPEKCNGCNTCVDVCRTQVILPNPEAGKIPIVLYPDECWLCGNCAQHCPREALTIRYPLNQRVVGWKRKETGEYFAVGMRGALYLGKDDA